VPQRLTWKQALEATLASSIYTIVQSEEPIDCHAAISALAVSPGIRDLNPKNPADDAAEIGRLTNALTAAWSRRRAPIIARSQHQPATIIIAVYQHQPATDRPDSRLFDVLMEEKSVVLEQFVTGERWMGARFINPLLYYWKTLKEEEIYWRKPTAKAMCYEPTSLEDWIERLEKDKEDPIGKVVLGGKTVTWPESVDKESLEFEESRNISEKHNEIEHCRIGRHHEDFEPVNFKPLLQEYAPQYFHSCRGCEYAQICFGPEPFPLDAVETYPGIYKKRDL
jgi:hypothetical protein